MKRTKALDLLRDGLQGGILKSPKKPTHQARAYRSESSPKRLNTHQAAKPSTGPQYLSNRAIRFFPGF